MNRRLMSPIMFAAAATILFLGAGCKKEQPTPSPAASPALQSAPVVDLPPANAPLTGLVAPAPTTPPPPDTPNVPPAPPSAADAIAPTPPPSASRAPAPAPTPRVVRVTAKQWEFVPAEIRAKKGERIVLEVTSTDVNHGLSLPDFNINRNLRPGATERIEFTPDKTGSFSMICSVFCGQGHSGMRGTLIVE